MFSYIVIFIIGALAGVFGMAAAMMKHREYIAEVTREIAESQREFAEKRREFEQAWGDGSRVRDRKRFRMSESGDKPVDRKSS